MTSQYVTGAKDMQARLRAAGEHKLARVADAVEQAAVLVINHAKAEHAKGAHAKGRYENKTGLLTQSMFVFPSFFDASRIAFTTAAPREYAADVEIGTATSRAYPFMFPALVAVQEAYVRLLQRAMQS